MITPPLFPDRKNLYERTGPLFLLPERGLLVAARPTPSFDTLRAGLGVAGWQFGTPQALKLLSFDAGTGPVVTSVDPPSAYITGAALDAIYGDTFAPASIVITGTGFTGATAVAFGLVPALSFMVTDDTEIVALCPPSAPTGTLGLVDVRVTGPTGTSEVTTDDEFLYDDGGIEPVVAPINLLTSRPAAGTVAFS